MLGALIGVLGLLIAAAVILAGPIALAVLFARTRQLRRRIDALELQVRARPAAPEGSATQQAREPDLPAVHAIPGAPVIPDVPAVHGVPAAPALPDAPETREVRDEPGAAAALRTPPAVEPESLETRIGTRWLLYIGVVAIVIGAAYFEKLAIDYGWIGEGARVIQGAIVGLGLVGAGTWFVRRGYAAFGQTLAGGGGAILYLSTYAAFNFYSLIGRPAAFVVMTAITGLIAWLADRQRSQALAIFAVGGGFATPFMLPGTSDAQVALFTYDAILIAGAAALSRRREWPFLHLVSYLFTLITVATWADRFYRADKFLRTELYLTLYCAMFVYIANECRRSATMAGRFVWLLLWTAPLAYYVASLAILADHSTALLVWLVALMLTGAIVSSRVGPGAGLGTWIAVATPLLLWCTTPAAGRMVRDGLTAVAAVYAIALLTELESTVFRDEAREATAADVAWVHLNPLVMYAAAYMLISPTSIDASGYLAAAFGAWNAGIAAALWRRRAGVAVHFLAVGLTLGAIATALLFNGMAVTAGWAVEGALVIVLGIRQRVSWLRLAGVLLFAVAVGQLIARLTAPAPAADVLVFNTRTACAGLVVALGYALAWFDWRDTDIPSREIGIGAALLTAQLVTLVALSSEIDAYWSRHNGPLQQQLTLSVTWALYATALVVIGLARGYAPIRYFAIGVLALTIGKVFFVDMAQLDRIYRVGSVVVLGVLLLVTSYLYSRSRKTIDDLNGRL